MTSAEIILASPLPTASAEVLFVVLLAAGVTAISAIVFVCWLFWAVVRLLASGVNHLLAVPRHGPAARADVEPLACPDPVCHGVNPTAARFCRKCGRALRPSHELSAAPAA